MTETSQPSSANDSVAKAVCPTTFVLQPFSGPALAAGSPWLPRLLDYIELTKPRIAILELVVLVTAACLAGPDPVLLVHAMIGTALIAGSASVWNQWLERARDARMPRTADRPLPGGRLGPRDAAVFGSLGLCAGTAYLVVQVNAATAAWGLLAWVVYVLVYTPLKSRSTANTHVGAVAGAIPVLMGWSAMAAPLDLTAAMLWTILFLWQFPHFMAIAWIYRRQYARAGSKMVTVVDPSGRRAGVLAVTGALALLPISLLPAILPHRTASPTYLVAASILTLTLLGFAASFCRQRTDPAARRLLRASLLYLPALLLMLMWGTH